MNIQIKDLLVSKTNLSYKNCISHIICNISKEENINGNYTLKHYKTSVLLDLPAPDSYKSFCDVTDEDLLKWASDHIERDGLGDSTILLEQKDFTE